MYDVAMKNLNSDNFYIYDQRDSTEADPSLIPAAFMVSEAQQA